MSWGKSVSPIAEQTLQALYRRFLGIRWCNKKAWPFFQSLLSVSLQGNPGKLLIPCESFFFSCKMIHYRSEVRQHTQSMNELLESHRGFPFSFVLSRDHSVAVERDLGYRLGGPGFFLQHRSRRNSKTREVWQREEENAERKRRNV